MKTISAVIITLNEECNIARCLQSLQGVADEIIVVDSGSTDRTQEICKSFGVKFIYQKWLGYGAQKNFANSLATCDYVLSLDADEALSDKLRESILSMKSRNAADIYAFNRCTNYEGKWIKHCGWYPDTKPRLWKNGIAEWSLDDVHERLIFSKDAKTQHLKGDLLHYTYTNLEEYIRLTNKYTSLAAETYYAKGKKASKTKVFFAPIWTFVRSYFLKRGFLDGFCGLQVCLIAAFYTFLKYEKLRQYGKK
ncbi:MAG: glycosyltransferase family 2 protein [Prevotellaceae bacterium]|jgi:glycosyltransferase involved in cell wall biosynthesis|nr:glycosyltransferase family 2 protein [Prevotellaceae bacterium]